jgi:hypothetical protein
VKRHYIEGKNLSIIGRRLSMDINTVRKHAYADAFPERTRQPGPSVLDPSEVSGHAPPSRLRKCLVVIARDRGAGLSWLEEAGAEVDVREAANVCSHHTGKIFGGSTDGDETGCWRNYRSYP